MNCQEFDNVLEGLLEGEPQAEATAHLAVCARCRLLVDELVAVTVAARALPEREPPARLWSRIEAAATEEGLWQRPALALPAWSFLPLRPALAGSFGVVLLVAVSLTTSPSPFATNAELEPLTGAQLVEVARAELVQDASYNTRFATHLRNVEQDVLEAPAPADAEQSELTVKPLDDLERAIAETQAHLDTYPDDQLARAELQRLYRQKASVLQAMVEPAW
jgi:hypothetical protein